MKLLNPLRKRISYFKVLLYALISRGKKEYQSKLIDLKFELDLNYFIDFIIYRNGAFQKNILESINTLVTDHQVNTFVDVGSHIGQMSLYVAKSFPNVTIVSLEPSPETRARQKANMSLNKLDYTLLPMAMSDQNTSAYLHQPKKASYKEYFKQNDGRFSLHASDDTIQNTNIKIEVSTLDSVLNNLKTASKLLVKLDVEGNELEVLKGGRNILTSSQTILIIELSFIVNKDKCVQVVNYLKENNFKMYSLNLIEIEHLETDKNIDAVFMNYSI